MTAIMGMVQYLVLKLHMTSTSQTMLELIQLHTQTSATVTSHPWDIVTEAVLQSRSSLEALTFSQMTMKFSTSKLIKTSVLYAIVVELHASESGSTLT